jgi:hypothetical protein
MADARRVRRLWVRLARVGRRVKLHELEPAVAVRRPHHRDVGASALETDDAVHGLTLDRLPALHLEAERHEELDSRREVVDDDANVVHALDCHRLDSFSAT